MIPMDIIMEATLALLVGVIGWWGKLLGSLRSNLESQTKLLEIIAENGREHRKDIKSLHEDLLRKE